MSVTTIPTNDRVERFTATAGQVAFPFDFPVFAETDLRVLRLRAGVETLLTRATDYTVTGAGQQAGGTVTLTAGAQAGDIIVIRSGQPVARTTQFYDGGPLPAAAINAELNRLFVVLQQFAADAALTMRAAESDASPGRLPPQAARIGRLLGFDGAGQFSLYALTLNGGTFTVTPYSATLLASADQAAWRAALGLGTAATLNAGNVGGQVMQAGTALAVRQTAGITATGDALATAASAVEARAAIGAAAVGRNRLLNGSMRLDSRNGGGEVTDVNGYTLDRWYCGRAGGAAGLSVLQNLNVPAGFARSLQLRRATGNALTARIDAIQTMEVADTLDLSGKTVTLSFWARAGANYSGGALTAAVGAGTGAADAHYYNFTGATSPVLSLVTLTTAWQQFNLTGTIPSGTSQVAVVFNWTPAAAAAGADDAVYITGVQLEDGGNVTAFEHTPLAVLAGACRRYFQVLGDGTVGQAMAAGVGTAGTTADAALTFETMRAPPTVAVSAASHFGLFDGLGSGAATALAANLITARSARLQTTAGGTVTAASRAVLIRTTHAAARLRLDAEINPA
jgi:hypothetical protein